MHMIGSDWEEGPAVTASQSQFWSGVARAAGGALLFSLPMLMTMELWQFGMTLDPAHLAGLITVTFLLLIRLTRLFGFKETGAISTSEAVIDAGVAYLVGAAVAAVALAAFAVLRPDMPLDVMVKVIAIEAVPASIGAAFARSQLGAGVDRSDYRHSFGDELTIMLAGAIVLCLNIAPTEEVLLVATLADEPIGAFLVVGTVLLMHGFVYAVDFRGGEEPAGGASFVQFTMSGFLVAAGTAAGLLWAFGRFDGHGLPIAVTMLAVLTVPAGIGAATARLVL